MKSTMIPPLHSWMRKSATERWQYKSLEFFNDMPWHILTRFDTFWHVLTRFDTFWHVLTRFDTFWHVLTRFDTFWHVPKTTRHALGGAVVAPLRAKGCYYHTGAECHPTRNDTKWHIVTQSDTKSHDIKQSNKLRHPSWQVKYITPEKDWITSKKPTNWRSTTSKFKGYRYGFGPKGCRYGTLWKFLEYIHIWPYILIYHMFQYIYIHIYIYRHILSYTRYVLQSCYIMMKNPEYVIHQIRPMHWQLKHGKNWRTRDVPKRPMGEGLLAWDFRTSI